MQNKELRKNRTIRNQLSEGEHFAELRSFLLRETFRHGYSKWNWNLRSLLNWHRYEQIVDEVLRLSSRGFVLDVGCGFGQITEMLHLKGVRAVGLDIGGPGVVKKEWRKVRDICDLSPHGETKQNKVWKHLLSSFVLGDGCTLPFASEMFDVVLCCGVLEHVYDERRFLLECGRVLKNDAIFLCYYLPNKTGFESLFSKFFFLPTIHKFYDKNTIEPLFRECGYEVLTVTREHVVPEPRFTQTMKIWNRSYKTFTLLDDALARTLLRFFGDNWRVYARKIKASDMQSLVG